MASYELIAIILTGLGLTASLIYYTKVLENQEKTRQTNLVFQLYQTKFDHEGSKQFWRALALEWKDFEDYMSRYGPVDNPENEEVRARFSSECNFFDGLGFMVKKGLIDLDSVYRLFGLRCTLLWYKYESLIEGLRNISTWGGNPNLYDDFEYLANEIIKLNTNYGYLPPVDLIHPTTTRYKHLIQ